MIKLLNIIEEINQENITIKNVYHGSPIQFDKFSLEFIGKGSGNFQEGAGIYFTSNIQEAKNYGKFIYKADLSIRKLISTTIPASNKEIYFLLKNAKHLKEYLIDFYDERIPIGYKQYLQSIHESNTDQFETFISIWSEVYRRYDDDKSWFDNIIKLGYDAAKVNDNSQEGHFHYIVYNIYSIKNITLLNRENIVEERNKPVYQKTFDEFRKKDTEEAILADSDGKKVLHKLLKGNPGYSIEQNNYQYYIIYRNEQGIPMAFISLYGGGVNTIDKIYADKSLRGKGIAYKLLDYGREHLPFKILYSKILSDDGAHFEYNDSLMQAIKNHRKIPKKVIQQAPEFIKKQLSYT